MEQPEKKEPIRINPIFPIQNVQKIYANGFSIGLTLSDLNIITTINGQPTHQLMMSLISAKALMKNLKTAVEDFEKMTSSTVPDIDQVKEALAKSKNDGKKS